MTLRLLSVGVVDVFAIEAYGVGYGDAHVDDLTKEAQVALSVLSTFVGVVVLSIGLVVGRANLRLAGLVVLGLATARVFLVDLASLDVAYRVITLNVLGLLLVASAYAWTRLRRAITEGPAQGYVLGARAAGPGPGRDADHQGLRHPPRAGLSLLAAHGGAAAGHQVHDAERRATRDEHRRGAGGTRAAGAAPRLLRSAADRLCHPCRCPLRQRGLYMTRRSL